MTTWSLLDQAEFRAREKWGKGFVLMGTELQTCLVKAEALNIIGHMVSAEGTAAGDLADAAMRWPF